MCLFVVDCLMFVFFDFKFFFIMFLFFICVCMYVKFCVFGLLDFYCIGF